MVCLYLFMYTRTVIDIHRVKSTGELPKGDTYPGNVVRGQVSVGDECSAFYVPPWTRSYIIPRDAISWHYGSTERRAVISQSVISASPRRHLWRALDVAIYHDKRLSLFTPSPFRLIARTYRSKNSLSETITIKFSISPTDKVPCLLVPHRFGFWGPLCAFINSR